MANIYTVVVPYFLYKGNGTKERIGGHEFADYTSFEEAQEIAQRADMEVWQGSRRVY